MSVSASNPFLEAILSAKDDRDFNEALIVYGTLQEEDVKDVIVALRSSRERRRKYASWMLKLCRVDGCRQPQFDTVRKTDDLIVWANLIEVAGRNEPAVLKERDDLMTQALETSDAETLAPALRVAIAINRKGIDEKCRTLLNSKDEKVLEIVLENLSPDIAKQEAPRLAVMLADEKGYDNVAMELSMAIIRSGDEQYHPQIMTFIERLRRQKSEHSFFNETTFSEDRQTVDFLWKAARSKDGETLSSLRDKAFDSLCRRVYAQDVREPVSYELMEMSLGYLRAVSMDTNPRAHINDPQNGADSAGRMIAFVKTGSSDFEGRMWGKDAVKFIEKWLTENKRK